MTTLKCILGFVFVFVTTVSFSQVTINQSNNIAEAMEIKKEVAKNESSYQIQIYNGNLAGAEEVLAKVREQLKQYVPTLVFETPNYKVRINGFRTQLEADKHLVEVRNIFPAAFVMLSKK